MINPCAIIAVDFTLFSNAVTVVDSAMAVMSRICFWEAAALAANSTLLVLEGKFIASQRSLDRVLDEFRRRSGEKCRTDQKESEERARYGRQLNVNGMQTIGLAGFEPDASRRCWELTMVVGSLTM